MYYGKALGAAGFEGLDRESHATITLALEGGAAGFEAGKFYTVKADAVIRDCAGFIGVDLDGAHGDLFDNQLVSNIWEAIRVDSNDVA
jgi:hypothetical protein